MKLISYSSELSSYSEKMMDITAYEQSFIYPHAISAITLTSTKFGITSKDVVGMAFPQAFDLLDG